MRKRVNCFECGKELDSVGLKGHRYYAHQIPYQSANLAANTDSPNVQKEAKSVNYSELADTIAEQLSEKIRVKREANTVMTESELKEHNPQDCPECNPTYRCYSTAGIHLLR